MLMDQFTIRRLRHLVSSFHNTPVLVVGDIILDHFIVGRVRRASVEAPVPIVEFTENLYLLGGAANVAHNIAALGGRVDLVGIIGVDESGTLLRQSLAARSISDTALVPCNDRRTTAKVRIVTDRRHQIARIDYEDAVEAEGLTQERLIAMSQSRLEHAKAVVVSDYLKGVVTKHVCEAVIGGQRGRVPVVVDPKAPDVRRYSGATVLKPNQLEAETATHSKIGTLSDVARVARQLRRAADSENVLVTRGEDGMWLYGDSFEGEIRATRREVVDVTGAGDTVTAVLAIALAVGASPLESATLANAAASIVVRKFGCATLTCNELINELATTDSMSDIAGLHQPES